MATQIWKLATSNAFNTTLDGSISDSDASFDLTTAADLQAPGVIVVDRVDANDDSTPSSREYISFTGKSSNTLSGCTRGLGGSTAQSHSSGAKVEEVWTMTHWNDFVSAWEMSHDDAGFLVSASMASLAQVRTGTLLNVSGASMVGAFPIRPVWVVNGTVSLATTSVGKPLPVTEPGTWEFFSATVRTPASGASLILDINKNSSSIFESGTRPTIAGGGTFVSTASINTKTFVGGDIFEMDIDNGGGTAQDLTVVGRGA